MIFTSKIRVVFRGTSGNILHISEFVPELIKSGKFDFNTQYIIQDALACAGNKGWTITIEGVKENLT